MLLGQVNKKLDDKNRISFPYRYRKIMGDKLIITKNMDSSLLVVSRDRWRALLEGTEGKPFIQKEVREIQRFLFGSAQEVELDEKGRFVLLQHLKEYSGIKSEAVFVGVFNRVEIWGIERWNIYNKKHLEKNINSIVEKLKE